MRPSPGVLIGAGFEYALTDNWTAKFEYNYLDFGDKVVDFTQTSCTRNASRPHSAKRGGRSSRSPRSA